MTAVLKDEKNILSYGINKEAFGGMVIARKTEINTERTKKINAEVNAEIYNDYDGMSL